MGDGVYSEMKIGFASVAPLRVHAKNPPTTLTLKGENAGEAEGIIKAHRGRPVGPRRGQQSLSRDPWRRQKGG